ncbi:hypothetical protein K461DRAFT_279122 [Myriangium duriaei CBS 260.36]|uniref:Secreted protein n=1 Tax=Myriangium duriaei CBS 260.36 TaxID=1168546 RepID=A0A9P4J1B7_9PEZI|nr:hypothetical protein K461DRAFT_279122 [Myriangium duriaei CBS 260.36]
MLAAILIRAALALCLYSLVSARPIPASGRTLLVREVIDPGTIDVGIGVGVDLGVGVGIGLELGPGVGVHARSDEAPATRSSLRASIARPKLSTRLSQV